MLCTAGCGEITAGPAAGWLAGLSAVLPPVALVLPVLPVALVALVALVSLDREVRGGVAGGWGETPEVAVGAGVSAEASVRAVWVMGAFGEAGRSAKMRGPVGDTVIRWLVLSVWRVVTRKYRVLHLTLLQ